MIEQRLIDAWGTGASTALFVPSHADDARAVAGVAKSERMTASPNAARAIFEMIKAINVEPLLPSVRVPTLVLHRADSLIIPRDAAVAMADAIPDARFVSVPGSDHTPWTENMEIFLDEIERFVTGVAPSSQLDRVLQTVLFTDIVGSTEAAAEMGDRAWRELLDRHDLMMRETIELHRGRYVKSTGDGAMCTFDGPGRAIRCALTLLESFADLGVHARAGLHTGEIEMRDDDLAGLAVHIAARVAAEAQREEVLVSRTVKDLVAGSGFTFSDHGLHALKGVPDQWQLFAVTS